jgi:hydroxyethylthiazole kinase-like uncharacterized protein yjeF
MQKFTSEDLKKLWKPREDSKGEDNGQVTIIGGSVLFHGAPLLAIKMASRMVDMVFFSSPDPEMDKISLKSGLKSFIWVPMGEIEDYIKKSDAVLIGPGLMRYREETNNLELDSVGQETREITKSLLIKFPEKQWVIDGGSLQVMDKEWIPESAILTPNQKEFEMLFNVQCTIDNLQLNAEKYKCIIMGKGPVSCVTNGAETYEIEGGNAGLTKGGTGDTIAGLTVGLAAKNPPILAAATASYVVKKTAERLYEKVGLNFNADDVAENVFGVMKALIV